MLSKLHELSKNNAERLNWDEYFMSIALLASQRSPCSRLHVGSVVVKNNRLISMGYNGYIPGAPHTSRVHDNHEQSIIHSEMNAIADCAKRGVSLEGAKIYVTHYPCANCFRSIAACGIKEVTYLDNWQAIPVSPLNNFRWPPACIVVASLPICTFRKICVFCTGLNFPMYIHE
jgi:dCMP deaminase